MLTGGLGIGNLFLRSVSPILTTVSGPNIATPFSTFLVLRVTFFGAVTGIISNSSSSSAGAFSVGGG
jgi:hypothetical protein